MVNGDCGWFIPATSCWPPSTRSSFAFDHHSLNTFASHRLAIVKARPPHQTRSTATPYTGSQGRRTNCNFEHKFAKPTTDCYGMNDKLLLLFSKVATMESGGGWGARWSGIVSDNKESFWASDLSNNSLMIFISKWLPKIICLWTEWNMAMAPKLDADF